MSEEDRDLSVTQTFEANGAKAGEEPGEQQRQHTKSQPESRTQERSPPIEQCTATPSCNQSLVVLATERSNKGEFLLTTNQWLGVGAALAAVVVAVYYGYTQFRLQRWQAKNDFYWDCLQASQSNYSNTPLSCAKALLDSPELPNLDKRDNNVGATATFLQAILPISIACCLSFFHKIRSQLLTSVITHLIIIVLSALLLQNTFYGVDYPLSSFLPSETPPGGQGLFPRWPVYAIALLVWAIMNAASALSMGFSLIVPGLTFAGIVRFARTFRLRRQQRRYNVN